MSVDTAFEEACDKVDDLLQQLTDAWNDIVDGVNTVLSILPGFLEGPVKGAFNSVSTGTARPSPRRAGLSPRSRRSPTPCRPR